MSGNFRAIRTAAPLLTALLLLMPFASLMVPLYALNYAPDGMITYGPTAWYYLFEGLLIAMSVALPLGFIRAAGFRIKLWHVLVLLFLVWVFFFGGMATLKSVLPSLQLAPTQQQPTQVAFNVGFTYQETNGLDGSSVTTTSPAYVVFHSNGARLSSITSLFGQAGVTIAAGSTPTLVPKSAQDGDYLFVEVEPGTAHYLYPAKFLASNPAFTGCKAMPVSKPNIKTFVCELQISRLGTPNLNIDPSLRAQILVPALPAATTFTLSSPANQLGLGTTANTPFTIIWQVTGLAASQCFNFGNIQIRSNQTSPWITINSVALSTSRSFISMPQVAYVGSSISYTPNIAAVGSGGGAQLWRIYPPSAAAADKTDGLAACRLSSDPDSIMITVSGTVSFSATGQKATVILGLQVMGANNQLQAIVESTVLLGS